VHLLSVLLRANFPHFTFGKSEISYSRNKALRDALCEISELVCVTSFLCIFSASQVLLSVVSLYKKRVYVDRESWANCWALNIHGRAIFSQAVLKRCF
jgi:hypothetical protein